MSYVWWKCHGVVHRKAPPVIWHGECCFTYEGTPNRFHKASGAVEKERRIQRAARIRPWCRDLCIIQANRVCRVRERHYHPENQVTRLRMCRPEFPSQGNKQEVARSLLHRPLE